MGWYGPTWGPFMGWWIMPLFGIVFLLICLFVLSRFMRGGSGSGCMMPKDHANTDRTKNDEKIDELKKEIESLREDVRNLKTKS